MDTPRESTLRPPPEVMVADLFPELLEGLVALLAGLSAEDWHIPTVCPGWSVKDVALHLLGVEVGNLSRRRDGHRLGSPVETWSELVALVGDWNESWVQATRRISTVLLADLLRVVGRQACDYFQSLDPHALGGVVSWAGPEPAPVWLDLAREYTERWHHQQHIRDAVGRPGMLGSRHLAPALATFVRAVPHAFRTAAAPDGATVTLSITGESGGRWSVQRAGERWQLHAGAPIRPDAEVLLNEDTAWRLFTRGLSPVEVRDRAIIVGDGMLAKGLLRAVAIIA